MTVKQLIKKLRKFPQDAQAVVRGYENGFDDVFDVLLETVVKMPQRSEFDGVYQIAGDYVDGHMKVVYIEPDDGLNTLA